MSGRDIVMGKVRRAVGATEAEAQRRAAVEARLASHPAHLIPARGQLPPRERVELFCRMAEQADASVERVADASAVPEMVAEHLRRHNLPSSLRIGADALIHAMPWERSPQLERLAGRAEGSDTASLSRAVAGVAETGTLLFLSGPDNPTTLNFLPDTHIALVAAEDIVGDYESALAAIRRQCGGSLPRIVNMITGPSRSADIEQTLILGAHGPRALHIIVTG